MCLGSGFNGLTLNLGLRGFLGSGRKKRFSSADP